jgi:hypothetical protein
MSIMKMSHVCCVLLGVLFFVSAEARSQRKAVMRSEKKKRAQGKGGQGDEEVNTTESEEVDGYDSLFSELQASNESELLDTGIGVSGKALCDFTGDPHTLTFDNSRVGGGRWHPQHAPGQWWIVRTQDKSIQIQAKYGGCGQKNGGGWKSAKVGGVPRTCCVGMAFSGSAVGWDRYVVYPACDYNWDTSSCKNGATTVRITKNEQTITGDGRVSVTSSHVKGAEERRQRGALRNAIRQGQGSARAG